MIWTAIFVIGILFATLGFGIGLLVWFAAGMSDSPSAADEAMGDAMGGVMVGLVGVALIALACFMA